MAIFSRNTIFLTSGSLTLESYCHGGLCQHDILYCQPYNSVKEIFTAGKIYPFSNLTLDTLAVSPGLVRASQRVGGAVSHKPLDLLRTYLHAAFTRLGLNSRTR